MLIMGNHKHVSSKLQYRALLN